MYSAPIWYHWVYNLSEPALYATCLLGTTLLALLVGLLLTAVRRYAGDRQASSFPPGLVTAIALPTSLVIGLMASDVSRRYNEAQDNVMQEARTVAALQHALTELPATASAALQEELTHYVTQDLSREWEQLQRAQVPLGLSPALIRIGVGLAALQPARAARAVSDGVIENIQVQLRELQRLRTQRSQLALGKMDSPQWMIVAVLLLCCAAVMIEVTVHHRRNRIMAMTLFVFSYGSLVYMIATNDRPFSGGVSVTPEPIARIFTQQEAVLPNLSR